MQSDLRTRLSSLSSDAILDRLTKGFYVEPQDEDVVITILEQRGVINPRQIFEDGRKREHERNKRNNRTFILLGVLFCNAVISYFIRNQFGADLSFVGGVVFPFLASIVFTAPIIVSVRKGNGRVLLSVFLVIVLPSITTLLAFGVDYYWFKNVMLFMWIPIVAFPLGWLSALMLNLFVRNSRNKNTN